MKKVTKYYFVIIFLIFLLAFIGASLQYIIGINNFKAHLLRLFLGFSILFTLQYVKINYVYKMIDFAYYASVFLLLVVEVNGDVYGGAKRWINFFGVFQLQPSELAKFTVIFMLAKYFHKTSSIQLTRLQAFFPPFAIVLTPFIFTFLQPDLGTSAMILFSGSVIIFFNNFKLKYIYVLLGCSLVLSPIVYINLHDYQKDRIQTFLSPSTDILGMGYHVNQSRIAIGSGGIFGKGVDQITQTKLNFLPEENTDFIFTVFNETFGFVGSVVLIFVYYSLFFSIFLLTRESRVLFTRNVLAGINFNLFLYVAINMCMVIGIFPVVGLPLPLLSYGGTSMVSTMIALGVVLNFAKNPNPSL